MSYYANELFVSGKFNYAQLNNKSLADALDGQVFLLIPFNSQVKSEATLTGCHSIEGLIKFFEEVFKDTPGGINILVHDCGSMQAIDGSKAKKGAGCKYLKNTLSSEILKLNIAVTFVSELRDPICERYFSS